MRRPRLARPSTSSWAEEVEENSRGRLLSPLEHPVPAVAGEPVTHSAPAVNREPAIHATPAVARKPVTHATPAVARKLVTHAVSAPSIPGGDHRVREIVREIKDLRLGAADSSNNNFLKRWEEAKKAGNLFSFWPHFVLNSFFLPEHRERERERTRLEMERMTLVQHTTAGALDRLGKSHS